MSDEDLEQLLNTAEEELKKLKLLVALEIKEQKNNSNPYGK